MEAVHQKYASEFTQQLLEPREEKLVVISGKVAEEVGFDKIRAQLAQLSELKIVLVDSMKIDRAETESKMIRDVCPKIVELDLSRNLFSGCKEIIKICAELDKLRDLRIKYVLRNQHLGYADNYVVAIDLPSIPKNLLMPKRHFEELQTSALSLCCCLGKTFANWHNSLCLLLLCRHQ